MSKNKLYRILPLAFALVLTSASLGSQIQEGAANGGYELLDVKINGIDPSGIIYARLRENITIEATWNFQLEDPQTDFGFAEFQLWNSNGILKSYRIFNETGFNLTETWTFSLDPENWIMEGQSQMGSIYIHFLYNDDYGGHGENHIYPIQVLPEELNVSLVNYIFNNDSDDRMESLNLAYHFQSVQDPSFNHEGLPIYCEILNSSNSTIENTTYRIEQDGYINITIQKSHLILLEEYSIKLSKAFSNKLEGIDYFLCLSALMDRIEIDLTYTDKIEVRNGDEKSIIFSFEFDLFNPPPDVFLYPVYLEWELWDTENNSLENGELFTYVIETPCISLNETYFNNIENLTYKIQIEGNFIIKGHEIVYNLGDLFDRSEVSFELLNYIELFQNANNPQAYYTLAYRLISLNHSIPLQDQLIEIDWINLEDNSSTVFNLTTPNETGHFDVTIPQLVLDQLEKHQLSLKARASFDIKNKSYILEINSEFPRYCINMTTFNHENTIYLENDHENLIYVKIYRDSNESDVLYNVPIQLMLLNEKYQILEKITCFTNVFGEVIYSIPNGLVNGDKIISLVIWVNSTLAYNHCNNSIVFYIEEKSKMNTGLIAFSFVIGISGILAFAFILGKRYIKNKFLSKNDYDIKVPW